MNKKILFQFLVPFVLILAPIYGFLVYLKKQEENHRRGGVQVEEMVPLFRFAPVSTVGVETNQSVTLDKYRGKVLILNFWATWCEACLIEMPSLQRLYEKYRSQGLELVALSVDENPEQVIPKTVSEQKWNIPIFVDYTQRGSEIFDIQGLPSTAIIDRNGKLLEFVLGETDWMSPSIQNKVEAWLKP
jgi:thiol-disulfide isomerase/thioredoxin